MKTRKLTKKSIISIIIILVAVSTIIGIYSIISNKKTNRTMLSPELERTQAYEDVKDGDNGIKDTDGNDISTVKFDAFFLKDKNGDGIAESIRGTCNEVGGQATLYMNLSVAEEGHLTNGKITINSENFYFNTSIVKDNEVEKNYVSTNTKEIKLKDITNGTQKLLMGSVRSGDYSNSYNKTSAIGNDTSNYSKENSVTFSGTYVDSSGNEKTFTKTVPFVIDWYGETDASITPKTQTVEIKEMNSLVKEEGLELNFDIKTAESKNQLLLESSEITGTIPEFNGYKPTSVKISGTNVTYTYDAETSTYTATKSSIIDENGKITSNAYSYTSSGTKYSTFNFTIIYPAEAYQELGEDVTSFELAIPVEAINKGYNNPNESDGFTNPYVSNTATGVVTTTWRKKQEISQTYSPSFSVYVGTYMGTPYYDYVVSKKKPINIYNGISLEEKDDKYIVQWRAYT